MFVLINMSAHDSDMVNRLCFQFSCIGKVYSDFEGEN